MNSQKNVKPGTGGFVLQSGDARVTVLTQMDHITRTSTATIRKDMAESVKKDVRVLKKFGLITTD